MAPFGFLVNDSLSHNQGYRMKKSFAVASFTVS
jgi:hypothetical protein